jgi:hypothetical protein
MQETEFQAKSLPSEACRVVSAGVIRPVADRNQLFAPGLNFSSR